MRPLFYEFPDQPNLFTTEVEYMVRYVIKFSESIMFCFIPSINLYGARMKQLHSLIFRLEMHFLFDQ